MLVNATTLVLLTILSTTDKRQLAFISDGAFDADKAIQAFKRNSTEVTIRKDATVENYKTGQQISSRPLCAVLFVGSCKNADLLATGGLLFDTPLVVFTTDKCGASWSREALHVPLGTHYTNPLEGAVLQLMRSEGWEDLVYIYDDSLDFNRLERVLLIASERQWDISVHLVSSASDDNLSMTFDLVNQFTDHKWKNLVIATRSPLAVDILQMANQQNMTSAKYKWLVLLDDGDVGDFSAVEMLGKGTVIILKRNNNSAQTDRIAAYTSAVLKRLADDSKPCPSLIDEFKNDPRSIENLVDRNVPAFAETTAELDVYSLGRYKVRTEIKHVGEWSLESGFNTTRSLFKQSFQGFDNTTLRVCAIEEPPFLNFTEVNGKLQWSGFLYDILQDLSTRLNFSFEIYRSPDGQYGAVNADGTWTGIVNELIHKKADIGLASLTVTSQREEVVDFTGPYMDYSTDILIQKPDADSNDDKVLFGFLKPFDDRVWIAIGCTNIVVGATMYLLNRIAAWASSSNAPVREFSFGNSMWFAIGTYVQQGSDSHPRSPSTRVLSIFWWFFCVITISTYTANMAAHMTVTRLEVPISSVEDLSQQTDITYGTVLNTQLYSYFRSGASSITQQMWTYMNSSQTFVPSSKEGIRRALDKKEKYAFLWDTPVLEFVTSTSCDVVTVGRPFNFRSYGIALPQFAPYKDDLSIEILKMHESGRMDELQKKWWKKAVDCGSDVVDETSSELSIRKMAGMFYFLAGGVFLSCLAIAIDCACSRFSCKNTCRYEIEKRFSSTIRRKSTIS